MTLYWLRRKNALEAKDELQAEAAKDSATSAGKYLFSAFVSAVKFAAYSIGSVGQFLFDGVKSVAEDGSWAKKAAENGLKTAVNAGKALGYVGDALVETSIAGVIKAATYVKSATEATINGVGSLVVKGLDYALSGSDEQQDIELDTFVSPLPRSLRNFGAFFILTRHCCKL